MLAIAGIAPAYTQPLYHPSSITENLFNIQKPNSLPTNFHFRLPNGNSLTLELMDITQLKYLVNIDSLIQKVWQDLQPLKDSLGKPLINRRVDYLTSLKGAQIRIVEYAQRGSTYKYLNDELVQTKIEQDTLRISLHAFYKTKIDTSRARWGRPYFLMLRLNNITDLELLPAGSLNSAVNMLQKDVELFLQNKKNRISGRYTAFYDVAQQKVLSPIKLKYTGYGGETYYEPYLQPGIQYLRGSWVPSLGVGMQLIHGAYEGNREVFKLYWEPHFYFSRSINNNLITQRNDFLTFKYNELKKQSSGYVEITHNLSVGYLVGRRGSWFESNTFKFSVPGLSIRNLNLEPEFVFNKFFRNFTPSLKLNFEIE